MSSNIIISRISYFFVDISSYFAKIPVNDEIVQFPPLAIRQQTMMRFKFLCISHINTYQCSKQSKICVICNPFLFKSKFKLSRLSVLIHTVWFLKEAWDYIRTIHNHWYLCYHTCRWTSFNMVHPMLWIPYHLLLQNIMSS